MAGLNQVQMLELARMHGLATRPVLRRSTGAACLIGKIWGVEQ